MKTKEFIKKVKELGFEIISMGDHLDITFNEYIIAGIYINQMYVMAFHPNEGMLFKNLDKLFDLLVEYAKTPLNEREEEKKFYLRHRWFNSKPIYKNYLNYWIGTNEYWLDYKNETAEVKTQFTEKEIENIKNYNNTDLKDFKKIEVKE